MLITWYICICFNEGSLPHLLEYETQRQRHNVPVMAGIDGLSKLYGSTWSPLVVARTLGLQATNALNPLKVGALFMTGRVSFIHF